MRELVPNPSSGGFIREVVFSLFLSRILEFYSFFTLFKFRIATSRTTTRFNNGLRTTSGNMRLHMILHQLRSVESDGFAHSSGQYLLRLYILTALSVYRASGTEVL